MHEIECACKTCRETKGLTFGTPPDIYELRQHKITKKYKYFKKEICHFCEKGYIIETKLFDRCVRCGRDIKC